MATAVEAEVFCTRSYSAAERVGEMVKAITEASELQSMTAQQVQEGVRQINRLVHEGSVCSQESAQACESLSELALELQHSMARFRLEDRSTRSYGLEAELETESAEPEMFARLMS